MPVVNEHLAERIRSIFSSTHAVHERRMFGGIAFLLNGHMCCGVVGDDLVVRVGPEQQTEALSSPHARPMDFTGRPMKGFVYVNRSGYGRSASLKRWINLGLKFVLTLPPK